MLDSKWRYPPFVYSLTRTQLKYSISPRLHSILGQTGTTTMTRRRPGSSSKTKTEGVEPHGNHNHSHSYPPATPRLRTFTLDWRVILIQVSVLVVEGGNRNLKAYSHTFQLWSHRHCWCYGVDRVLVGNCIRRSFSSLWTAMAHE